MNIFFSIINGTNSIGVYLVAPFLWLLGLFDIPNFFPWYLLIVLIILSLPPIFLKNIGHTYKKIVIFFIFYLLSEFGAAVSTVTALCFYGCPDFYSPFTFFHGFFADFFAVLPIF